MFNKKILSVLVAGALAMSAISSPILADDAGAIILQPQTADTEQTASALGRVFGVEGHGGDIAYYSVDMFVHTPAHAAWRSALAPGWGQLFNRQYPKGYLMMGSFLATGGGALLMYNKSRDSYDEYKARGLRNGDAYDDYERQQNQSLVLGVLAAAIWGYSIVDAHRNAYHALWSDSQQIHLAAGPEGARIIWEKKF
jgi:hypothetical protein